MYPALEWVPTLRCTVKTLHRVRDTIYVALVVRTTLSYTMRFLTSAAPTNAR